MHSTRFIYVIRLLYNDFHTKVFMQREQNNGFRTMVFIQRFSCKGNRTLVFVQWFSYKGAQQWRSAEIPARIWIHWKNARIEWNQSNHLLSLSLTIHSESEFQDEIPSNEGMMWQPEPFSISVNKIYIFIESRRIPLVWKVILLYNWASYMSRDQNYTKFRVFLRSKQHSRPDLGSQSYTRVRPYTRLRPKLGEPHHRPQKPL